MRGIVFAVTIFGVCLWLSGCSGKTEKTDDGKSKVTEKSEAEKAKPDALVDSKWGKAIGELARDASRAAGQAAATTDLGRGERIGKLAEALGETKLAKDLSGSKRLGAFMRAVGLSPAKEQSTDATHTPSEPETLESRQPKPNLEYRR
jgi:hypothetical protein